MEVNEGKKKHRTDHEGGEANKGWRSKGKVMLILPENRFNLNKWME